MGMKYRCPLCGKRVVAGRHFCSVDPSRPAGARAVSSEPAYAEAASDGKAKRGYILSAAIASLLVAALSWQWFGVFSLFALALAPIVYYAARLASRLASWLAAKSPRRVASKEYLALLMMVGRDEATAERLIRSELERDSARSRAECIRAALERLERDRSR